MKKLMLLFIFIFLVPFVSAEATVKGIVLDSLDNLVGFADVKLDCIGQQTVAKTDKFGTFSIKDAPEGQCRLFATYKDGIGFQTLDIKANQTMFIELQLDKTIITLPEKKNYWPIVLLIALIFIIFWIYFKARAIKQVAPKVKPGKKPEPKKGRAEDILKTLSAKEQQIVKLVMENKNTMIQANIRRELDIPRTSLTRLLQGLKGKNIVSTKKMGKTVRVSLTDWFLGK